MVLGDVADVRVGLAQGLVPQGASVELDLAVQVTGRQATGRSTRAMVLCLDRSGSMSGGNIKQARAAAAHLIRSLADDDEVALVTFGGRADVEVSLRRATPEGKAAALRVVEAVEARGGTDLHGGLTLATQEAVRGEAMVRRVVLISDGMPTEGDVRPGSIIDLARRAASRGTVVTAVAVGSQSPGGLMERVATSGGGSYRFLRDGSGLQGVLAAEMAESAAVVGQDTRVQVDLPPGVQVLRVAGAWADTGGSRVTIPLGDVVTGQARHVLVTVRVPAAGATTWAFPVAATARRLGQPVQVNGQVSAGTSGDAAAVANSAVTWVRRRADLATAAEEVRSAAQSWEKGDQASGRSALQKAVAKMERAAAADPALAAPTQRLRAFASGAAAADGDAQSVANEAHEEAFKLTR
jgi:Ca-activated chloride channel family protein